MTENEAKERCDLLINSLSVNTGVESAFRNDSTGYMDFTTMREFAQTCKNALEEVKQYRAIGTPEELRSIKENGAFTGMELAQLAAMQMRLKKYEKIGTPEECQTAMELYKEMHKRKFTLETADILKSAFSESKMYDQDKVVEQLEERTVFLKDCTKYGNNDAEQQAKSYDTMMMYEVAELVEDLVEIVKRGGIDAESN